MRPGLLFAGSERGVFVSFDDGANWQPLQNGLPTTSVRDITIHGSDLVIATHGRGFYVLDDIVPLRALTVSPAASTRLFPIADAIRVNEPAFAGTPMPKDEPMAANPPLGAYLDYNLQSAPRTPLKIQIFDSSGRLVNSYSSADRPKPIDLSKLDIAPEWALSQAPPEATPGEHRFVWNLSLCTPAGIQGRWRLFRHLGTAGPRMWSNSTLTGRHFGSRSSSRRSQNFGEPAGLQRPVPACAAVGSGPHSQHILCFRMRPISKPRSRNAPTRG